MSRTKNLYIDEINILQLQKEEHEQYMYALGEAGGQVNFSPTKRVVIHWKGSHSAWYMCGPEVVEILESRRADIGSWYVIDHAMVQFGKDQQPPPPIPQESLDDIYDSLVDYLINNNFCEYLKSEHDLSNISLKIEVYDILRKCHDKTLEETVEYLFREFKYNSAHEGIEEGIKDVFKFILGTMQDDEMWAMHVGCLPF